MADFLVLALVQLAATQAVDAAMLGRGHQPGARIVGHAGSGPLFERGDECVLRELFGNADIAHDAREAGDEPGRLDPPDRVDFAMDVGSRHGFRSDHLAAVPARLWLPRPQWRRQSFDRRLAHTSAPPACADRAGTMPP